MLRDLSTTVFLKFQDERRSLVAVLDICDVFNFRTTRYVVVKLLEKIADCRLKNFKVGLLKLRDLNIQFGSGISLVG